MGLKVKTIEELKRTHQEKRLAILAKLREFAELYRKADDQLLFEELVFCICAAGFSAKGAMRCVEAAKPVLMTGSAEEIAERIRFHLYPQSRAEYIVHTREYLKNELGFRLKEKIESFTDPQERRDFFAANKGFKGIGYKEASHFLRNIGFRGYAILDKHILRSLAEFGVIESDKPPSSKKRYLETEAKMKAFADDIGVDIDELDLLLWSNRTGEILK